MLKLLREMFSSGCHPRLSLQNRRDFFAYFRGTGAKARRARGELEARVACEGRFTKKSQNFLANLPTHANG